MMFFMHSFSYILIQECDTLDTEQNSATIMVYKGNVCFLASLLLSTIDSRISSESWSGPSMQIRMVCSRVSSPILFRSLVFISFIWLKLCSTVAVVNGITSIFPSLEKLLEDHHCLKTLTGPVV